MIQLETNTGSFITLPKTDFKIENILERSDFQKAIVASWEDFRTEIGFPQSYLIGQEIKPHASVNDAIDLLAFDQNDNAMVVIELKRDKNKYQLLQAISYASMVATWNNDILLNNIQKQINAESQELIEIVSAADSEGQIFDKIKIVLISEYYDPEVILASEWLNSQYRVDISAFSVKSFNFNGSLLIDIQKRYPLKELSDIYVERRGKGSTSNNSKDISWDDVLPKLKFDFASQALELCRREKNGDPSRRRFINFRSHWQGFDWISVGFRINYINLYIKGKPEEAEEIFRKEIGPSVQISEWAGGYSVNIKSNDEFQNMVKWLKMGKD